MRFVQFTKDGNRKLGLEIKDGKAIVDLNAANPELPSNLRDFIKGGDVNLKKVQSADSVRLEAPISRPEKVLCVGMNYRDHCREQGAPVPEEPVVFGKFPSCIIGPQDDLHYPAETEKLDWEVELALIIGKEAKHVQKDQAMDYIFGFCVALDVSARDWQNKQKNGGQVLLGKAMDEFCPLGPVVVTKDEVHGKVTLSLNL